LKIGKAIEILERLFVHLLRGLDIFLLLCCFRKLYSKQMLWKCEKRSGIIVLNDESTVFVTELVTTNRKYLPGFICRKITKISQSSSQMSNILSIIHILSQMNLVQVFTVYNFIISFEVVLPFLHRTPKNFKSFDTFH